MSKVTGVKIKDKDIILLDCLRGKKEFGIKVYQIKIRNSWFQACKLFSETYMNVTDEDCKKEFTYKFKKLHVNDKVKLG